MKDRLKFLSIYYTWMLIGIPLGLIFKSLNIDVNSNFNLAILNFVSELIIFTILFIIYRKDFVKDFKEIKKTKGYIKEVLKIYVGELVVAISAGIVMVSLAEIAGVELLGSDNNNLAGNLLKSAPIFMAMGIVFLGPVYEEGIMRLGLRKGIKNKGVFAIVSGFIFGIMHVVDNLFIVLTLPLLGFLLDYIMEKKKKNKYLISATSIVTYVCLILGGYYLIHHNINSLISISELIYSITYISIGVYFAIIYLKKKNIFYTIGTHMLVNTIATIFLFFI